MRKTRPSAPLIILHALHLTLLLTACGQRGPLYLPDEPAAPAPTQPAEDPMETEVDEEDDLRNGDLQFENSTFGSVNESVDGG